MRQFIKEGVQSGELAIYEVLEELATAYNDQFAVLELPYAIEIDTEGRRLILPYYEGENFATQWDETNGGSEINLTLATEVPRLLQELGKIKISRILDNPNLGKAEGLAFDADAATDYFTSLAEAFQEAGLLSAKDCRAIKEVLATAQTSSMSFNNGDFYPCNLIRRPNGKLLLLDWETWNDHSPFFVVDHPENVAAVMYVHMWGNPAWQALYRDNLMSNFDFNPMALKKGIIMKALQLAGFWYGKHQKENLVANQISLVKEELKA